MCGRFSRKEERQGILARFKASESFAGESIDPKLFEPRYNLAPGHTGPVIVGEEFRHVRPQRWGLVPWWAKDAAIGQKMINARAETLAEKPSFKSLLFTRRCIVPATGFYEWAADEKRKIPMHFRLKSGALFGFAALWDQWTPPNGASGEMETFTIVTTTPNGLLAKIHHRMPVILRREDEDRWLDPELKDLAALLSMLLPYAEEEMEGYEVSRAVNSPAFDGPECTNRLEE
jgi:putative SOS response-associated peptidase YedK